MFFFQAEDGIRDGHVTGVQTCALPISRLVVEPGHKERLEALTGSMLWVRDLVNTPAMDMGPAELAAEAQRLAKQHNARFRVFEGDELAREFPAIRSEERRVGEECCGVGAT